MFDIYTQDDNGNRLLSASFSEQADADRYAQDLRDRGDEVTVEDNGLPELSVVEAARANKSQDEPASEEAPKRSRKKSEDS